MFLKGRSLFLKNQKNALPKVPLGFQKENIKNNVMHIFISEENHLKKMHNFLWPHLTTILNKPG
jgi:hypothetical protein